MLDLIKGLGGATLTVLVLTGALVMLNSCDEAENDAEKRENARDSVETTVNDARQRIDVPALTAQISELQTELDALTESAKLQTSDELMATMRQIAEARMACIDAATKIGINTQTCF